MPAAQSIIIHTQFSRFKMSESGFRDRQSPSSFRYLVGVLAVFIIAAVAVLIWRSTHDSAVVHLTADSTSSSSTTPEISAITVGLRANDPATFLPAIKDAKALLSRKGLDAIQGARVQWLRALEERGADEELADLAQSAVLAAAEYPESTEKMLALRVYALLRLNRAEQAVSEAKSLYNVATINGSAQAIDVLGECLDAYAKDGGTLSRRFRLEQAGLGLRTDPTAITDGQSPRDPSKVLEAIEVDAGPYERALDQLKASNSYPSLATRGNLLLLAGRVDEASKTFERALTFAKGGQVRWAHEGLARCMRAQDGNPRRAREYVRSLAAD